MSKFKNTEELEKAQKTIELQKMSNDALKEENIDRSYDITDLVFERANDIAEDWEFGYQEEIKELKQQLALKETELGNMQSMYESVTKSSAKCFKENVELREQLAQADQDKISFCVEQLEKVKNAFNLIIAHNPRLNKVEITKEYIYYIDNQIEELKKGE